MTKIRSCPIISKQCALFQNHSKSSVLSGVPQASILGPPSSQRNVLLVRCSQQWEIELNTRREILYLHAPMNCFNADKPSQPLCHGWAKFERIFKSK